MRCVAGAILDGVTSSSVRKSKSIWRSFCSAGACALCGAGFCATAIEIRAKHRMIVFMGRVLYDSCTFLRLLILSAYFKTEPIKMLKNIALFVVLVFVSPIAVLASDEWSQFRGPNGTGVSDTKGLPTEFGPNKNVVWKTELPAGHSSPVLTRDRIFVTAHDKEKLYVIALDRQTGKILWQREVPRAHTGRLQNVNGPASPSSVTDGTNVYVFFQDFGMLSYDAAGKERWKLPLGPFNMFYGFGASPILVDDKVILPVDQDNPSSYLIAVDKNTGKLRWKVDRPVVISGYSTPIVYQPKQGAKQIIIPESFQLSAYSVADGKRVWWVRGLACEMKSIASHDSEYLYINGLGFPQNQPGRQVPTISFEEALAAYDTDKDHMITKAEVAAAGGTAMMDKMLVAAFEAFEEALAAYDKDKDHMI